MNLTTWLAAEYGSASNIGIFFMDFNQGYLGVPVISMAGIYVVNMLLGP